MTAPRATYRLQFRGGMDFETAAGLVPYLSRLGISHLYASPLFAAVPGSTHGYDVTDFGRFDDRLGGFEKFEILSANLHKHGLGLILDIVPNHMAASCHNPWWRDIVRHGRKSVYADYFDIDWSRPKLLLPVLDRLYGAALAANVFSLGFDPDGLTWEVSGQSLPLDPLTWPLVLDGGELSGGRDVALDPTAFRQWQADVGNATRLAAHLKTISSNTSRMHDIHEAQPWRLAYWRAARDMLGYRRFFEISDLVGVRVEEPKVFDAVHGFLFELIDRGHVDGLRVDHIDGLVDPKAYLDRLDASLPRPVPIWAEKILEHSEELPGDWRLAGTTGYEFLDLTSAALTNGEAASDLDRAYAEYCRIQFDYAAMQDAAKREILTRNLAAELETLVRLACRAFEYDIANRDWGRDTLRRATIALLVAMPVYRTYFGSDSEPSGDESIVARIVEEARRDPQLDDTMAAEAIAGCLVRPQNQAASEFRTRFQQVSGALMAKALEDTLFYRFNRLVSANEVGADPFRIGIEPGEFHAFIEKRAARQPLALNATATHDTKRGEDARMRIAAISEDPTRWIEAMARFDALLARDKRIPEIDANTRWLFYQAVLGSWDPDPKANLTERIGAFLLKASRESKQNTSWVKANPTYEDALQRFAETALSSTAFVDAFASIASRFIEVGERKSLVQLALKLTAPGVPDIYQGTEAADLSLVDPDNRRPVDFEILERRREKLETDRPADFNERKLALLRYCLGLRRQHPDVFAGDYRALPVHAQTGSRLFAFARTGRAATLVVIADLSGARQAMDGTISLALPDDLRLHDVIATFPGISVDDPTSPDDATELDFDTFGVSLRLYAG